MTKKKTAKTQRFTEELLVELSEKELLVRGKDLSRQHQEAAKLESYSKQVKDQLKADAARIEAEKERLAAILRDGKELRPVECEQHADYDRGIVQVVRLDTLDVVRTRALLPEERQDPLPRSRMRRSRRELPRHAALPRAPEEAAGRRAGAGGAVVEGAKKAAARGKSPPLRRAS